MAHRLLLTSVVIFVKPGTTAQLAAAFIINLAFLVLHVQTNAFETDAENGAQFNGLISITLVLFSGIILRWNSLNSELNGGSSDVYNDITINVVLIGSQIAILAIFVACIAAPSPKANAQDRLEERAIDAASKAAAEEIYQQMDIILNDLEQGIKSLGTEGQLSLETTELGVEVVAICRVRKVGANSEQVAFAFIVHRP